MPRTTPEVVHLATRTCYSLRDGVIRPRELAQAAAAMGMPATGIADRGGLYGGVRFTQACADAGVKPIYGADLALHPDTGDARGVGGRPGWGITRASSSGIGRSMGPGSGQPWLEDDAPRITLIASDDHGFATLNRTITEHHMTAERGDPHLGWDAAVRRLGSTGGLVVLLGERSPVGRLLEEGREGAARKEAMRWLEIVGADRLLVGITHHLAPGDDARARRAFALADDLGLRAVAHQAARYLVPADARVADVMDAVRQQVPLAQHHSARRNAEGYLKDPAAMARVFAERPDALANTLWVAERCEVDMGLGRLRVPDFVDGGGGDPAWALAELRRRCEHGLVERFPADDALDPAGPLRTLLDRELDMVARLGLASYFLTVGEVMQRIRDKGILAACRGSAAGSLITYALRISDVDPIAHDLAFERFMNPYRDELPDIDIDVESARREEVYRDLLDTYGSDRVACVCMVETFKARMAIREVGKAMGLPAGEVDYIAKSFPHVRAGDVRPALAHLPELQGLNIDSGHLALLFDVVERMDGFPRHIALHPSGVLLADATLPDIAPMERSAPRGPGPDQAGFAMVQYDKDDVEALGLCKLDVLAIRMLSSMAHCTREALRVRGEVIDFDQVGWDDADTYELIRSTRTLGMFQIESPGQRELIGKFQPEHHGDLVVDISLFRPGPVKGDMIRPFLRRRHGEEGSGVPHPILERALGETFGVIVYHEQVMRCVAAVTGCDLAEADLVRRRLGDPTEVPALERWIKAGARKRGVPPDVVDWLWTALSQFASFGFCKAHAAAFSVPTYRSAWLKARYLPEFMAGILTHDPGMYPRRLILDDARQFGVAILPLDVNASVADYRVEVVPADEALDLLGVTPTRPLPRGWRVDDRGALIPSSGFDKGSAGPGWRYGIRLALQDVERIDDHMVESILQGRPFTSVDDLRLRARLSQPVAESLTHAGALDLIGGVGLPLGPDPQGGCTCPASARGSAPTSGDVCTCPASARGSAPTSGDVCTCPASARGGAPTSRVKTRRDLLLEVNERWSGLKRYSPRRPEAPQQLGLLEPEDAPGLPEYRPSERVRAELEVVGMDATRHVITFYDTLMDTLGVTRAAHLLDCREKQRVRIAGVKVATQTPPVKSGQRVIFLSLDDATGIGDAAFFETVHDRCAWTVFHTWLLVVEGVVHRSGRRGISITADRAWDLRRLMVAWRQGWLDEALAEQGRPDDASARDFSDQAPSNDIRGAAGRSGLAIPGRGSRVGPNGATWADPAGRHPGVDAADVSRLAPSDPRHPDHPSQALGGPARKLWHASPGSSGR